MCARTCVCVCVCVRESLLFSVCQVLEVMSEGGRCVRCDSVEGVREFVNAAQQHAMLLHHLKRYIHQTQVCNEKV